MRKIIILSLGLTLLAVSCNRSKPTMDNKTIEPAPVVSESPAPAPQPSNPPPAPPAVTEITITASGFTPSTVSIKKGDTVKFTNFDSIAHWPASAPHPSHTNYPEFDSRPGIAAGSSWSFKFLKIGTWSFHDHLNPGLHGTVIVTE